ncbi:MAG: spore coat protein [Brevibacillus sp.]|nr:spore coat protein [Brevibacillus sp.]
MNHDQYGAHEIMELQEVLTFSIDALNLFRLYLSYAQDPELQQLVSRQMKFMTDEYNSLVHLINGRGLTAGMSYRPLDGTRLSASTIQAETRTRMQAQPVPQQPNRPEEMLDDRDVSSTVLGFHKASAKMRMEAALECADEEIRSALIQGAINCAQAAYEIWQYMARRGYYHMPTMQALSSTQILRGYQPTTTSVPPVYHQHPAGMQHSSVGPVYRSTSSLSSSAADGYQPSVGVGTAGIEEGASLNAAQTASGFSAAMDQPEVQAFGEPDEPASRH